MNTLKNKLTNLLALNRGVFNRADSTAHVTPTTPPHIDRGDKVSATQLEPQKAANDNNNRPDWFQAIHDADYHNE